MIRQNPPVRRQHLGIILVLVTYLVLGTYYSVATPILEASDEIHHYPFVKLLTDGKGLPIQKPLPEDNLARQEGSQPPLYYALAAAATFWVDTGDFNSLVWVNPHAQVGTPLAHGNKNMTIHGPQEDFPFRGPALAIHVIRWLTLLMGVATIICTYRIARLIVPSRLAIALAAAALVAFNPEFNFIAASVNNDNLMTLLASVIVFMLVYYVKTGITYRRSLLLGVALGLALLSKLTALGLIPLIFACLVLICLRQRSLTIFLRHAIVVSLTAALIAGWWYVRNWRLYGDPTGLSMMLRIVGVRVPTPGILDLLSEFQGFRISFWGLFGGVNIIADERIYQLLDGVTILAVLGLVLSVTLGCVKWVSSARSIHEAPVFDSIRQEAGTRLSTLFSDSSFPVPS
ncbi:MAG: glycosyltransferase family 39 protein, partial [Dehalococcoidia bacterium]|nr:glycosyltransferase family 39 protein [Dehalococcoidia bacterium]